MDRLLNILKGHASALDNSHARPRFALVTSVDPSTATARVALQPEGVLTGWLPILSPSTGSGWGIWCPPTPGDQVLVLAQDDDAEQGVIVGLAFSLGDLPPPAAAGELWLVHRSGSSIRLLNSGVINMVGPVSIQGTVAVSGDVLVAGDISDQHATLADLRAHYNVHSHIDSRGGTTSAPAQQD